MRIGEWLAARGLAEYTDVFEEHAIEPELLSELTDEDLQALGVRALGHRRRILRDAATGVDPRGPPSETDVGDESAGADRAAQPERRQLTILFADLVDSTRLARTLDPEDLRDLNLAYQRTVSAVIERRGGFVARYMGDGVLAYFGYPHAHEDDAERAVLAGLDILEAVAALDGTSPLAARAGIATGPVVVGDLVGEGASEETAVVGETANLAARLQAISAPGTVCIATLTRTLVRGLFELESLGARPMKGYEDAQPVWRVLGPLSAESRFTARQSERLAPLTGRDAELALLRDRWESARRGEGQSVLLGGEAGIGKSRLAEALLELNESDGPPSGRVRYQCSERHVTTAFHPFARQLRAAAGIEPRDAPDVALDKLERSIRHHGSERPDVLALMAGMLELPGTRYPHLKLSAPQRMAMTVSAIEAELGALCEEAPVLVVFEDAHWLDPSSLEVLESLVDRCAGWPMMLLVTHRPEASLDFAHQGHVTELHLNRLGRESGADIVRRVSEGRSLPESVVDRILDKADGVPLFVEELTRAVHDGSDGDDVPDTLHDSLMARLDRIGPAREVAQIAACIGREFDHEILLEVSGLGTDRLRGSLEQLEQTQIVIRHGPSTRPVYTFKHALVQDVAYASLLRARRREVHLDIARALERGAGERIEEHAIALGHHLRRGGASADAARYMERAARGAVERLAIREAFSLYGEVYDLIDAEGPARDATKLLSIAGTRAGLCLDLSDFALAGREYRRAVDLAAELDDDAAEGRARAGVALAAVWAHDYATCFEEADEAIALAERSNAHDVRAAALYTRGLGLSTIGELDPAKQSCEESLDLSRAVGDTLHQVLAGAQIGIIENFRGNFGAAIERTRASSALARSERYGFPALVSDWILGLSLTGAGEYDEAFTLLRACLNHSNELGDEVLRNRILNTIGWIFAECGGVDRAIELNAEALDVSEARSDPETISNCVLNIGDGYLSRGDPMLALEQFERVRGIVKRPSTSDWQRWRYAQHLFAGLGETRLAMGDVSRAQEACNQCLELATATASRKYLARGWRLDAEIALARQDLDRARQSLSRAVEMAEAIGNPTQQWRSCLAEASLEERSGHGDRALELRARAAEIVSAIGSRLRHPELEAAFERSPVLASVLNCGRRD